MATPFMALFTIYLIYLLLALLLVGFVFIVGKKNDRLLPWVFKKEIKYGVSIFYILFQVVVGMLLFALAFNLCNELKYGPGASTAILPVIHENVLSSAI